MGYLLAIFGAVLFTVASMKAPAMGVVMVALCVLLGIAVYPVFPMFYLVSFPGRNADTMGGGTSWGFVTFGRIGGPSVTGGPPSGCLWMAFQPD